MGARRHEIPVGLDHADRNLAARSQPGLRRRPGGLHDDERRPELESHQPRSDEERQIAPGEFRRHHIRQPDDVRRRDAVCDRRVAGESRRDLDGQQRRSGERHAGCRRTLDQRHDEHSEPAAVGHGVEHRAIEIRRRHRIRRRKPAARGSATMRWCTRRPITERRGSSSRQACRKVSIRARTSSSRIRCAKACSISGPTTRCT